MSIKFYCFAKDAASTSVSGYCDKLEALFRASGFTDYTLVHTNAFSAPKGKLPYIEYTKDGKTETIADSHFITRYLADNNIINNLDKNLTAAQRADSRAWQSWFEDLIYGAVAHERYFKPENFAATRAALPVPWFIRPFLGWYLRRKFLRTLWDSGIGRHSEEERNELAREFFDGLEVRLKDVEYFHGNEPTSIDAILCGLLANTVARPGNPHTTAMITKNKRLRRYLRTMLQMWFPEYKVLLAELDDKRAD